MEAIQWRDLFLGVLYACWQASSRIGCDFIDDWKNIQDRERVKRRRGPARRGEEREGRHDDKGMGGGLDDGVMCCFRANCFCDSGTTSFIAIGYNQELIEAGANEAVCHWVWMGGSLHVFLPLLVNLWENNRKKRAREGKGECALLHCSSREHVREHTENIMEHDMNYCMVIMDATSV